MMKSGRKKVLPPMTRQEKNARVRMLKRQRERTTAFLVAAVRNYIDKPAPAPVTDTALLRAQALIERYGIKPGRALNVSQVENLIKYGFTRKPASIAQWQRWRDNGAVILLPSQQYNKKKGAMYQYPILNEKETLTHISEILKGIEKDALKPPE